MYGFGYTGIIASMKKVGGAAPPSYPASLKLFIDAGNAASYPGSGTTVTDLTINSNNCTLLNGTGYSSSDGGIFTFDGVNDNISTPIYSTVTEMSGMFWINLSSYVINPPLLVDVGQGYIEFKINSAGRVTWGNFGSTTANGATTLSPNTWYAVGFSHKTGQTSKVYLNGVLDGSSSGNQNNIGNNSAALKLMTNSVLFSSGKLGNVKIFNAEMLAADYLAHFNEFKARYGY
jgi:hypothetical protein